MEDKAVRVLGRCHVADTYWLFCSLHLLGEKTTRKYNRLIERLFKIFTFFRRRGKQAASPVKVFVHSHQGEFEVETCKKPGLALL